MGEVVGRLAPSPTGGLHLGHARTFLVAWLAARSAGGRVILRIEDIDAGRVRAGMVAQAVDDLRWLGLDWDEGPDLGGPAGPYEQSRRGGHYEAALERLKAANLVYPCTCTRSDVARLATAPHEGDEGPSYPGTCRGNRVEDAERLSAVGRRFAWRFRVAPGAVGWDDLVAGPRALDPARCGGDFLVGRSTGEPSYQLAVVVDDAAMGITQVIRGEDLGPSTPRQILLHRALGFEPPRFGHVGLVHDVDGRRLAKRDGAIKLSTLRDRGLDPRRLVGWLAASLGWAAEPAPTAPADLIGRVDPVHGAARRWHLTPEVRADLGIDEGE